MAEVSGRTSEANSRLWSARASDWADVQEGQCRAVYVAVFDHLDIGSGIAHFDAGCGSGDDGNAVIQFSHFFSPSPLAPLPHGRVPDRVEGWGEGISFL